MPEQVDSLWLNTFVFRVFSLLLSSACLLKTITLHHYSQFARLFWVLNWCKTINLQRHLFFFSFQWKYSKCQDSLVVQIMHELNSCILNVTEWRFSFVILFNDEMKYIFVWQVFFSFTELVHLSQQCHLHFKSMKALRISTFFAFFR